MGKYLKKFATHSDYTAAESGLILPNVSLCVQENEVHYKPVVPDPYGGHDYVDLGLPSGTKWATMNVGATSETDYGNYYAYGKGSNQWSSSDSQYNGTENPLAESADTATQIWGSPWHMPTLTQLQELTANTTHQNVTIGGVNGSKFTAQNGNYIFIPAAGCMGPGCTESVNVWSSTPSGGDAYALIIDGGSISIIGDMRLYGYSIRPVAD